MPQTMASSATIVDVIDRILDKGLVINADIRVSLVGVELLEIKIRAALASFETAAKYGMELPSGTNTKAVAWKSAYANKTAAKYGMEIPLRRQPGTKALKSAYPNIENCPLCKKRVPTEELFSEGCPWCYWKNGKADR
jgi:hypothetical protein